MIEMALFLLRKFSSSLGYAEKETLLHSIQDKLEKSFLKDVNFLAFSRNPVKIILLIVELLDRLKMTSSWSPLRVPTLSVKKRLLELARTTIKQYRAEEVKREIFLDCDLFGRDVVTLICETDSVDLLEDYYIEKLADEAWDGPT